MGRSLLFAIALMTSLPLHAALIEGKVAPEEVTAGDPLTLTVTYNRDDVILNYAVPGKGPVFNEVEDDQEPPVVPLYAVTDSEVEEKDDAVVIILNLVFYQPGEHRCDMVRFTDEDETEVGYRAPVVTVKAVNEQGKLADIEPPLEIKGSRWRLWLVVGIALATAAMAGYLLYRYLKKKRDTELDEPRETPFDEWLRRCGEEEIEKHAREGEALQLATVLSHLFRIYIQRRTGMDAEEMTTEEIIETIGKRHPEISGTTSARLQGVMHLWDMIKFAEFSPSPEVLTEHLGDTKALVENLEKELSHGVL